jgi:hypothetical protein
MSKPKLQNQNQCQNQYHQNQNHIKSKTQNQNFKTSFGFGACLVNMQAIQFILKQFRSIFFSVNDLSRSDDFHISLPHIHRRCYYDILRLDKKISGNKTSSIIEEYVKYLLTG